MSDNGFNKQDRTARLVHELTLLAGRPHGFTTRELAQRMDITQRTAQRDLVALQEIAPLHQVENRWRLVEGYVLPKVNFTLHEAMALLLAGRLMLRYADRQNLVTTSAFEKLAAVLPEALRTPLMETAEQLSEKPADAGYTKAMVTLTTAWAERRKVAITYASGATSERVVWPLFLEPSAIGHSCYLIAHDEKSKAIRSFKVERIKAIKLLEQRFDPPLGFSVGNHLANAWTIWSSSQPVDVELLFSANVADRVLETNWHPSQVVEKRADGKVRVRLTVASTVEIRHWILGWGDEVEVVKPLELREEMKEVARAMVAIYEQAQAAFSELVKRAG
jgi:proteasome accessory factor B